MEPRRRRSLIAFRARFSTVKRAEGATSISTFDVLTSPRAGRGATFERRRSTFDVLVLAVLAAVAAGAACRRPPSSADITIGVTVTPQRPVVGEPVAARLSLRDTRQRPIAGATIQLEAHMTHPGMAPVIEPAPERGGGQYDASLSLTMAGDWVLFADVRTADGQRVRKEIARLTARTGN